jgi:hypothetical protein
MYKEMLNNFNHNSNQNDTAIPYHPSQNCNYEANKQQVSVRMVGKREPLCTVAGNVN